MTEEEIWKHIPNSLGYEASNHGNIRSPRKLLKKQKHALGYQIVGVKFENGFRSVTVHSMVAAAFHGPRPIGLQIAHLNHLKTDNRPENLEYQTMSQNMAANYAPGGPSMSRWRACEIGESFEFRSDRMRNCAIRAHTRFMGKKYGRTFVYDRANHTITRLADPVRILTPKERLRALLGRVAQWVQGLGSDRPARGFLRHLRAAPDKAK